MRKLRNRGVNSRVRDHMQVSLTSELSFCLPSFPFAGHSGSGQYVQKWISMAERQEELLLVGRDCFGSSDSTQHSDQTLSILTV